MDYSLINAALFWLFSLGLLGSALGVILNRGPVTSALCLVATMVCAAALMIQLEAYFLGTIQVLVYAGAVMVLFLFIVMMLDLKAESRRRLNYAALAGAAGVLLLAAALAGRLAGNVPLGNQTLAKAGPASALDVAELGRKLFGEYLVPFEVTSILLLVAMVGVIMLSHRPRAPRPGGKV
jgi:NADH-quinone oxidoreductase subunit J